MRSLLVTKCVLGLVLTVLSVNLTARSQTKAKPAVKPTVKTVRINLNAPGELLITNAAGKRIGYDAATGKEVNTIAGASVSVLRERPPVYIVPFADATRLFKIRISGKTLTEKTTTDLAMTGEGFVTRFDDITLNPNEILTAAMSPNGRELIFTAGADGETPAFSFAVDPPPGSKQPSYIFKLSRANLSAGKTIKATLDIGKGKFYFGDDDSQKAEYALSVTRINADGTENNLTKDKISFGKANRYLLDFGKWNGTDAPCFYADDKGKNFANEKCVK